MIRMLGVFLLLGLYYPSLDRVHTRPKGLEDGSLFEGANKGIAHKRGSDRAAAIGDQMRAAKAAKRDAEAHAALVVVDLPNVFSPSGPTSKPRSRGRTARQFRSLVKLPPHQERASLRA